MSTGLVATVWGALNSYLTHRWVSQSSPLSVRLPLTSPDSIDIGRGSSTDLEAQSLRMVRDFDDPAAGEAAIRKSSITPNSPAGHPEEPLPPGLLGNPAPNHSSARLSSSQIYREASLSLTNAPTTRVSSPSEARPALGAAVHTQKSRVPLSLSHPSSWEEASWWPEQHLCR